MQQAPPRRNVLPHWLSSYARDVVSFEQKSLFLARVTCLSPNFFCFDSTANDLTGQQKTSCCILLMEKKLGGQSV
jgi:hypothetical protein